VLIVDEAQNLSDEVLEEIRLLTNLETFTEKLLQIVLVDSPSSRPNAAAAIAAVAAAGYAARQNASTHAGRGSRLYQSTAADRRSNGEMIFEPESVDLIYRYSGGIPVSSTCCASMRW